jgi:hypothetical protein
MTRVGVFGKQTMSLIAIVENGVWTPVVDGLQMPVSQKTNTQVIDAPMNEIDRIAAYLGQVVRMAQNLSEPDARRVRDFVRVTLSMLEATTYLPAPDQARFEHALRDNKGRGDVS